MIARYRCRPEQTVEKKIWSKSKIGARTLYIWRYYYDIIRVRNVQLVVWSATLLFPGGSERGWIADSHRRRRHRLRRAPPASRVVWRLRTRSRPADQRQRVCFCASKWVPRTCTLQVPTCLDHGCTTTTTTTIIIILYVWREQYHIHLTYYYYIIRPARIRFSAAELIKQYYFDRRRRRRRCFIFF